jgi:hypothetical protein
LIYLSAAEEYILPEPPLFLAHNVFFGPDLREMLYDIPIAMQLMNISMQNASSMKIPCPYYPEKTNLD